VLTFLLSLFSVFSSPTVSWERFVVWRIGALPRFCSLSRFYLIRIHPFGPHNLQPAAAPLGRRSTIEKKGGGDPPDARHGLGIALRDVALPLFFLPIDSVALRLAVFFQDDPFSLAAFRLLGCRALQRDFSSVSLFSLSMFSPLLFPI